MELPGPPEADQPVPANPKPQTPEATFASEDSDSESDGPKDSSLAKRADDRRHASGNEDDLRICIQGVREFTKDFEIVKDLDKIFASEDLGVVAILKEPNRSFFFLKFCDKAARDKFFSKGKFSLRNRDLKMKFASVSKAALKKERSLKDIRAFIDRRSEVGKAKLSGHDAVFDEAFTKATITDAIKQRICAFGGKPYPEQIALKREKLEGYLKEIKTLSLSKLKPEEKELMAWLKPDSPTCCPLKDFVECAESGRIGYRTKSEFTIGYSVLDKCPKVGFNISGNQKAFHSIELTETAEDLMTIPPESFRVAKCAEELIKSLDWPLFDKATLKGFWRFVVVRISQKTNQMVINFVGNRKHFESPAVFESAFREKFVDPLVQSLSLQPDFSREIRGVTFQHAETSNDSIPYVEDEEIALFHGPSKTYSEEICGCTFEVSSSSFLQINIGQSEQMYRYAAQCAGLDDRTILLDICSGIGTIGISMGRSCRKVVGVEMVRSACQNALRNAAANGMAEKYEVVEGKVEERLEEVAGRYSAQGFRIVGIVDPPRAGLHPDVVRTLRTCKGLDDLIFICCDIKQSKANIIELCLPQNKKRRGPPFSPLFCTGFDMFPHTPHFESLFVLRRLYEDLH